MAFTSSFEFVINPQKRIFWLYLLSSVLIAWAFLVLKKTSVRDVASMLKTWWSRSCWVDLQWFFANNVLLLLLVIPMLGGQFSFALWINRTLIDLVGQGDWLLWAPLQVSVLFTLVFFIFEDFSRFLVHYSYHKVPLLWRFHAIHHSATVLTPLTLYRVHSVEAILNAMRGVFVLGLVSGVFMYVFKGPISAVDILGANVFAFLFNLAGSNLRHSSIFLGFGVFEKVLVSPAQHQIHHSAARKHWDKNFGATLSIWDRVFGSWMPSRGESVSAYSLFGDKAGGLLKAQLWGFSVTEQKPGRIELSRNVEAQPNPDHG